MRRVLVLFFQPIRFVKFDKESANRGLPVLEAAWPANIAASPRSGSLAALGTRGRRPARSIEGKVMLFFCITLARKCAVPGSRS